MTTNEERREVARRLRDYIVYAREHDLDGDYVSDYVEESDKSLETRCMLYNDIASCIEEFGNFELSAEEVFTRLADLIEPATDYTSFALDEFSKDGKEVYPTRWWKCANCGEETIMMYDEGEPVACPYCGARITEVDNGK